MNLDLKAPTVLRVSLPDGQQEISLSAADVEKLIAALASYRANMQPEVPRSPPARPSGEDDPLYAVYDLPALPGKILVIRHGKLGWLGFQFPQPAAAALATGLLGRPTPQTSGQSQSRH